MHADPSGTGLGFQVFFLEDRVIVSATFFERGFVFLEVRAVVSESNNERIRP